MIEPDGFPSRGPTPTPRDSLRIQILGPLRIRSGGDEVNVGPSQQAKLLALLAARVGRPIGMTDLVDLMWGEAPPESAVNTIHKYVGSLRHLLEPRLPARQNGSYLLRQGDRYLCAAGPDTLDLAEFRSHLAAARTLLAQRHDVALDAFLRALGVWSGPAGEGLNFEPSAMPIFAGLNDEFFDACVTAAALALTLGRAEEVLAPLQLGASLAPLHEPLHASLVSVLGAVGRQAEALAVFDTTRRRLAEELGIDPGQKLQAAYRGVLEQAIAPEVGDPLEPRDVRSASRSHGLVGRSEEVALAWAPLASTLGGGSGLVFVEGEPGLGKTRLIEEVTTAAQRRGARVIWGRCLDGAGVPAMWPWLQIVPALLAGLSPEHEARRAVGELTRLFDPMESALPAPVIPDSGSQFRLFEELVAVVGATSVDRPLVLVIDDLQWADVASLETLGHLATRIPRGTAIVAALRDSAPAPSAELTHLLARASRLPAHCRIQLAPLTLLEIIELVRRETGHTLGPVAARSVHLRSAGNPFFVREISRLLLDADLQEAHVITGAGVPATVLDVVRERMHGLDADTIDALQLAALIGKTVDLALLARAAGIDEQTCLDRLEPLTGRGLLGGAPGPSHSFQFTHDLVRESVADLTPRRSLPRMHLQVAESLEQHYLDNDSVIERIAHHLWAAGAFAEPTRTADALVRAGRCAAGKSAYEAADRQLSMAVEVSRAAGLAELELSALSLLTAVRSISSGYVSSAFDLLQRAEELARVLGREREAADLLFTRWAAYSQGTKPDPSGTQAGVLARRLLEQGESSSELIVRAYGWNAWGIHQWDLGNIGEAFRYLSLANTIDLEEAARGGEDPIRRDMQMLWPLVYALLATLHGDVAAAETMLAGLEPPGDDDLIAVSAWAAFSVLIAAVAGDTARARRAAERGLAADRENGYAFFGSFHRLGRCWASALTGDDPAGAAAEAQTLIVTALVDPPRSGLTTWYALLAEMLLAAGRPTEAGAVLDRSEAFLDTDGQRYAEGLVLVMRAHILDALGESTESIRAAAERARRVSIEREAHLFAQRADALLVDLASRSR